MIQLQSIIKPEKNEQLFWRQVCMTSLAQIWQCGLCIFCVVSEAPAKICLMKGCTTSMLMSMPWTAKAGIAKNCRIHMNPLFSLTLLTEVWQSHWQSHWRFLYVSKRFSMFLAGQSPLHLAAKAGLGDVMHWLAAKASFSNIATHRKSWEV